MSEQKTARQETQQSIKRAVLTAILRPTALYVLVFILLTLATVASHTVLVRSLAKLDEDTVLINMSGRQRMLSEQTFRLAGELMDPASEVPGELARKQLQSSLALMLASHDDLTVKARIANDSSEWGNELDAAFFEGKPSLDLRLKTYFEALDTLLTASAENTASRQGAYKVIRSIHQDGLLVELDSVVEIYEARAQAHLEASRQLHFMLTMAMVSLLLFVTLFVVHPLIRRQSLDNAELIEARDKARAELIARSAILAAVSHEIRTPLGGVLGIIDQLKRERSPSEREQAFDLMEDSCHALLDTLDAILEQARLSQGSEQKKTKRFRPNVVAQRVAELFRPLARRKAIRIEFHAESTTQVFGDPARVQQVLANLVSNAVKFTQTGVVNIYVQSPAKSGQQWAFVVTDTGAGMDQDRIAKIFHAFDTIGEDSLGRWVGTGLGLSITRDLVEAMGGRIEVESEVGRGSSFTIFLPFEDAEDACSADTDDAQIGFAFISLERATAQIRAEATASLSGWKVLSREDALERGFDILQPLLILCDAGQLLALPEGMVDACTRLVILADDGQTETVTGEVGGKTVVIPPGELVNALPELLKEAADERA